MYYNKKYRVVVAAFLLALYAFVATPTNAWHHHATDAIEKECGKPGAAGLKIPVAGHNGKCLICDHQYAAYDDVIDIAVLFHPTQFHYNNSFYRVTFLSSTSGKPENKGPPELS